MRLISMTLAIACFLMPAAIRADDLRLGPGLVSGFGLGVGGVEAGQR